MNRPRPGYVFDVIVEEKLRATPSELTTVTYGQWEDGDLAVAVVRRDEDAYTEVCRRHRGAIRSASEVILGCDPASDDVVADVLIAFWVNPELFDPARGMLHGYLTLKARGRSIDLLRSRASRHRRELTDARTERKTAREIDSRLLAEEAGHEIARALALLPASQKLPICLAFYEGMSYTAVARHLQIPEGTVKSRIRAGLRNLRGILRTIE